VIVGLKHPTRVNEPMKCRQDEPAVATALDESAPTREQIGSVEVPGGRCV
jgi:hypothetical protein